MGDFLSGLAAVGMIVFFLWTIWPRDWPRDREIHIVDTPPKRKANDDYQRRKAEHERAQVLADGQRHERFADEIIKELEKGL